MQLSPPVPVSQTSAATTADGCNNPAAPADPAAAAVEPFDSLLSDGTPTPSAKPVAEDADTDAEKAAAILAASFWMPLAPVVNPPPLPSSPLTAGTSVVIPTGGAVNAAGLNASVLPAGFGPTSSRSFATLQPAMAGSGFQKQVASPPPRTTPCVGPGVVPGSTVSVDPAAKGKGTGIETTAAGGVDPSLTATPKDTLNHGKDTATDLAADSDSGSSAVDGPVQEKIASSAALAVQDAKNFSAAREKYFLDPVQKAVTADAASVGISVAKLNATMSAAAPVRQKSASISESTTAFVFSGETAPTATLTADAPAPVATVRETMAAVISAVDALERQADVQHKSVDLQFNVGSEKLGLRVELKDGTIHTTFHTESSEMNGALAREWHNVVQPALAREIRLAEPVFSSSGGDSATGSPGQGFSQQREQQKAAPTFASALQREFYDSTVPESAPAVSPASNSSQLLNALA